MKRLTNSRWFPIAFALSATLVGVSFVLGDERDRTLGFLCLCLAAAMWAAGIGALFGRPEPPAVERVMLPDGSTEDGLVLRYVPYPPVLRAIVILAMTPILVAILAGSGVPLYLRAVTGLAVLYFVVSGSLSAIARVRAGRSTPNRLALTRSGCLLERTGSVTFVPWAALRRASLTDVRGTTMLMLAVASDDAVVRPGASGLVDQIAGGVILGSARIPVTVRRLAVSPRTLEALVTRFAEFARSGDPHPLPDLSDLLPAAVEEKPSDDVSQAGSTRSLAKR